MMKPDYTPLWYWIREREAIRIKKELGMLPPWTGDEILAAYRFCNVRREDDAVTRWIDTHVRQPYRDHPRLWFMLAICRQINWPDTIAELIRSGAWPTDDHFTPAQVTQVLAARRARGNKVYTGAYLIPAPPERGADKQAYVAEVVLGDLWQRSDEFSAHFAAAPTMQGTHERLRRSLGWGDFLAYQAVVDMRFSERLLASAPDRDRWAAAGPGTLRGLNRIHERALVAIPSQAQALDEMRAIYQIAERETGVSLDFSDVPNVLCETDKYLRVLLGQGKPRAKYVPGRGA